MSVITDEVRATVGAINANLSHVRVKKTGARYLRYDRRTGKTVEVERPNAIIGHSMFPYKSSAMAVHPSEVASVKEMLRKHGLFTEFDSDGCPIITSAKQQSDLAKALGMKTGRDGYGHTDESGKFQNSGRRRAEEMNAGRSKVQRAIRELNDMPENSPAGAVCDVLGEYDILPSDENTG